MNSIYDYYITPEEYMIAEQNGICRSTLEYRVRDGLWEKENALTKSPKKVTEWSRIQHLALQNNICRNTFEDRRKRGWSLIDSISKPPMSRKESLKHANQANKNNCILSNEEIQFAKKNGLKRSTLYNRVKNLKWDMEVATTSPIIPASERGRMGKEASYWSKF